MIEKNIRLEPHHSRDLLVGRRSDNRRPKYQPAGGGATSLGSGRDVGGGGRSGPDRDPNRGPVHTGPSPAQMAAERAAAAAAERAAAAQREMQATIARAEADQRAAEAAESERMNQLAEARRLMTQPADVLMQNVRTPKPPLLGQIDPYQQSYIINDKIVTAPGSIYKEGDYDEIDTGPEIDARSKYLATQYETAKPTMVYDPEAGEFVEEKPSLMWRSDRVNLPPPRDDRNIFQKTVDYVKKNPLETVLNVASFGGYEEAKQLMNAVKFAKGAKKFSESEIGTALTSKFSGLGDEMKKHNAKIDKDLAGAEYWKRGDVSKKKLVREPGEGEGEGEGAIPATISEAVTGRGLESGQEMLGLTQYKEMQNQLKLVIDEGVYQGRQLNMNEMKMLQNKYNELSEWLNKIEQAQAPIGVAHGGRISKALEGRNRYI